MQNSFLICEILTLSEYILPLPNFLLSNFTKVNKRDMMVTYCMWELWIFLGESESHLKKLFSFILNHYCMLYLSMFNSFHKQHMIFFINCGSKIWIIQSSIIWKMKLMNVVRVLTMIWNPSDIFSWEVQVKGRFESLRHKSFRCFHQSR